MTKILILSYDVIGTSMAGPGIRFLEFAKQLSKNHDVALLCLNKTDLKPEDFSIDQLSFSRLAKELKSADVVITQFLTLKFAFLVRYYGVKVILDAYDPTFLEHLEINKNRSQKYHTSNNKEIINSFLFSFKFSDFVICANEKQRDLWLGFLFSRDMEIPIKYKGDSNLSRLIDLVPFGLSSKPLVRTENSLRERFGLKKSDKIILWGGGIWNWFDPLTLLKAMKILQRERAGIHLIFMGVKHPNEKVPEMDIVKQCVHFSKENGLIDQTVHFNFGWTPYEERVNFLKEADIGISTHLSCMETRFSFRTRLVDYLWANLPIVSTEGDFFSEFIQKHDLGHVVPYQDPEAIVEAIVSILDDPNRQEEIRANIEAVKPTLHWEKVVAPIEKRIEGFSSEKKSGLSLSDVNQMFSHLLQRLCRKLSINNGR